MFLKPQRVKNQTQLKSTERKKFYADVSSAFPSLSEQDLLKLFPSKSTVILLKVICFKNDVVHIYQVQNEPLFFKLDKLSTLYPTVYFLWQFPFLIKSFTTQEPVIHKLVNGADLMIPGIEIVGQRSPYCYGGVFPQGAMVCVNTTENKCPVAIGKTAHCSMDMYMTGGHGKGVSMLHVFGDNLWESGSKSLPPKLGPPSIGGIPPSLPESDVETVTDSLSSTAINGPSKDDTCDEVEDDLSGADLMDHLLVHCFIKAWKTSAKKIELPVLTSNFYRVHMLPCCPDSYTLDIKKSSFKKLSKFLGDMKDRNLVEVIEHPKGVENITGVNFAHEDFKNFIVDPLETQIKVSSGGGSNSFSPPILEEVYQVSGTTVKFFRLNGFGKGVVLSKLEVRNAVTEYVKKRNLNKNGMVEVEPTLHEAVVGPKEGYKEFLRWDEVFSRLLGKMSPAFRITYPGRAPIVRKGKLECIEIATAKRTGNKKVTLIYNVGVFGIDENTFAHQIQVGVAASTCVGPAEHRPMGQTQILVQGNQVAFVAKLLLETYQIPRKYIKGLELLAKGKK